MTTVTPFPLPRFTPSDRAELFRWSSAASGLAGWSVWEDPETGMVVGRTEAGTEYVSLAQETGSECAYTVLPHRGRWELIDAAGTLVSAFRTLRDALESVCRTPMIGAR